LASHSHPLSELTQRGDKVPHPQPLSLIRRGEIKLILYRGEVIAILHSTTEAYIARLIVPANKN
jgi:hypothetical protein